MHEIARILFLIQSAGEELMEVGEAGILGVSNMV
jgi:hypothetical protein